MRCAERSVLRVAIVVVSILAGFSVGTVANGGVDLFEVVVWEHPNFTGQHKSWKLEDNMRHRLVTDLGFFDERISSIQVGAGVRVAVYSYAGFAGWQNVYSTDVHSLSDYWNDEISSLIVFPKNSGSKTLDHPLGVVLREVSCFTVTGYTPVRAFYPLPQRFKDTEAGCAYIGDYMEDEAFYIMLQGDDVEVEVFYEKNFGIDDYTLTFPKDALAEEPNSMYLCDTYGYREIDLTYWYPWAVKGKWEGIVYIPAHTNTQSLKVRWTGPPPGDTRSPGFVPSKPGPDLVEPSDPGEQAQPELIPHISGTWQSTLHLIYEISQEGHEFTWYVDRFHEWGHGTIHASELAVTWEGENGGGHDVGVAILDDFGNVVRIEWGRGNIFFRREAPSE